MNVGELNRTDALHRLRTNGLPVRVGPFAMNFKTNVKGLAAAIHYLYADFSLVDDPDFIDFRVSLIHAGGFRRWILPYMTFIAEGTLLFRQVPVNAAVPYWEWGINRCIAIFAQHYLILHAAVVERNGNAMVIVGGSGSGKSTLCSGLAFNGWRLLSDELTMLSTEDHRITAVARPITLKNESLDIVPRFGSDVKMGPKSEGTIKGTVAHVKPPMDSIRRGDERATPGWFVFVNYEPGAATQLEPVTKAQAVMKIAHNAFNYGMLGAEGFQSLTQIVDRCDCCALTYSDLDDAISLFNSDQFGKRNSVEFCEAV